MPTTRLRENLVANASIDAIIQENENVCNHLYIASQAITFLGDVCGVLYFVRQSFIHLFHWWMKRTGYY
jgi:hypothetical protein